MTSKPLLAALLAWGVLPAGEPPPLQLAPAAEGEDQADPYLEVTAPVWPWTHYLRAPLHGVLLPTTATAAPGTWSFEAVHASQRRLHDATVTDVIGWNDRIRGGLRVSYGLTAGIDATLGLHGGYDPRPADDADGPPQVVGIEVQPRLRLLDTRQGAPVDLAVLGGLAAFVRDEGRSPVGVEVQVLAERSLLHDRLRLGAGLAMVGFTAHSAGQGVADGPVDLNDRDEDHRSTTSAILTANVALNLKMQAFAEIVAPITGVETEAGFSAAAGLRVVGRSLDAAIWLGNTAETSFAGALIGGHSDSALDLLGWSLTARF